jgi:hypothetical protein
VELNIVMEADSLVAQREVVRKCDCYSVVAAQAIEGPQADSQVAFSEIESPSLVRFVTVSVTLQRPLSRASRVVLQAIKSFWPGPSTLVELAMGLREAKSTSRSKWAAEPPAD